MASLSLLESAKTLPDGLNKGVMMTYALAYHPMTVMPMQSAPTGVCAWNVEDQLPHTSGGFRNVNGTWTASVSQINPYSETSRIAGGRVQVDRFIESTNPSRVAAEKQAQIKAMAKLWTAGMFNGDGGTYLKGIDYWIDNVTAYSSQNIDTGTASAGALLTTDHLDSLLNAVNTVPGRTFIYMPDKVALRARKLARGTAVSGDVPYLTNYTPEQWGFFAGKYDDYPIIPLKDGKGSDLLETNLGDDNSTCVYAVTYGEDMFSGFQVKPMEIIALNQADVYNYFDLEWYSWCAPLAIRSIARLRYVENAVA